MAQRTKKAWVVAVDMGYGHQRAASALRRFAFKGRVVNADSYPGIPAMDKLLWKEIRTLYEIISRFKKVPVIGDFVFSLFIDQFQEIKEFYPKTQGIEPATLQLRQIYRMLQERDWGKHFIALLNKNPIPLVTTFSVIAFMAEHWGYKGPILLVETDSDIARAWAPLHPAKSSIVYCAPTERVVERLKSYGVLASKIFLTGFPLPEHLLGKGFSAVKRSLSQRLSRLDPERAYLSKYSDTVKRYLGAVPPLPKKPAPCRVTFAVGGAGAQQALGMEILQGMVPLLERKAFELTLVAGTRKEVAEYWKKTIAERGLAKFLGKSVRIMHALTKEKAFLQFEDTLAKTDILWTKPSELSFYAGFGIPIVIAPPIGSQEIQNRKWLLYVGAGLDQLSPKICYQWLGDFVRKGVVAEAAMQGFIEIEKEGAKNIGTMIAQALRKHEQ
ncbi:MAG: hypothetical protein A3C82_00260 [Candidatus Wildermuthbacteria bacterium RIFCSPHIGHO2_02_FULL_47_12]|uniref:DUF6938 domain-containing protein n=1 Tax=Candidatus Wildermuthbacteria bacterium RIFCSPHIGHO2_02_FULL_47_12 TaxID=1802451 RepID=A0A1G2R5A9_9BACT|nr:MAG: hypothetical protein A3C82_00260 [Candidatus Wildermuthbacteria bacterium RIFCSPHIGHO2_02_FULL_47_12]